MCCRVCCSVVAECCSVLQCVAVCSSVWQTTNQRILRCDVSAGEAIAALICTLQHTAIYCNTLKHAATRCTKEAIAARICTQQHSATLCNILQHTLQNTATHCTNEAVARVLRRDVSAGCSALQCVLQCIAVCCSVCCSVLQFVEC